MQRGDAAASRKHGANSEKTAVAGEFPAQGKAKVSMEKETEGKSNFSLKNFTNRIDERNFPGYTG